MIASTEDNHDNYKFHFQPYYESYQPPQQHLHLDHHFDMDNNQSAFLPDWTEYMWVFPASLFLFRHVTWLVDLGPLTTYAQIIWEHRGSEIFYLGLCLSTWPHLLAALFYYSGAIRTKNTLSKATKQVGDNSSNNISSNSSNNWSGSFPSWQQGLCRWVYVRVFLPLTLWTQLYTWWLPYLFRWGKPYQNIERWSEWHKDDYCILPNLGGKVVPDAEATVLLGLSALNLWLCHKEYEQFLSSRKRQGPKAF
jgi:hypothetical protein